MRKRRWMGAALVVSLAVNLAVVAAVSGAAWRHMGEGRETGRGGPHAAKGGAIYMQALPREMRKTLHRALRDGAQRPRFDAQPMIDVLRQTPFDASAAAAVLAAEQEAGHNRARRASAAWLEQITAMSVTDRAAYTERLQDLAARRAAYARSRDKDKDKD